MANHVDEEAAAMASSVDPQAVLDAIIQSQEVAPDTEGDLIKAVVDDPSPEAVS